ncbi:hypothetical protein BHE74_00021051 [Ensete ventricosum]|nr:hypothetical protein BHE74_00021051 [Ensete ventricosum]
MAEVLPSPSHFPSSPRGALSCESCDEDSGYLGPFNGLGRGEEEEGTSGGGGGGPIEEKRERRVGGGGRQEVVEEEQQRQLSVLALVLTVVRKSLLGCKTERAGDEDSCSMDIGCPTDVQHVAHVTFDRFHGFLGLPVEFEPEVPRIAPSARSDNFLVLPEKCELMVGFLFHTNYRRKRMGQLNIHTHKKGRKGKLHRASFPAEKSKGASIVSVFCFCVQYVYPVLEHPTTLYVPEKPTLIESLSSWSQIMSKKPVDNARFTEILGELRFQEKPAPPPASIHQTVPPPVAVDRALSFDLSDLCQQKCGGHSSFHALLGLPNNQYVCSASARCHDGFPPKNSDKLQLCTERLGSESSDDVDDLIEEDVDEWSSDQWKEKMDAERQALANGGMSGNCSDVRTRTGGFPPPVYSIGKSGRPWIYYRSYRKNGRFVLTEIRIPTQEFLRASRQDGRLRLQLVHPDEDIAEGDEGAGGENEEEVDEEDEKTELSQGNDH